MLGDFASLDVQNTYRGSDAYDAKFKVILTRFDAQYTPELQELTCTFDVPETIYNVDNFPVSAAGSTYIFPEPMQQKVIVIATIQSGTAKTGEVDLYIGGH